MSIEHQRNLTHSDLKDCKRKLFTNSDLRVQEPTSNSNLYKSATNKPPTNTLSKETTTKKIKLKGKNQTEIPITPLKHSQTKLAASPNLSTFLRSPLQDKQLNIPKQQRIEGSQFYSINQTQGLKVKRFTSMFSEVEVIPSPQKKSLNYSRINKTSICENSASKSEQRKQSKSKKKMHFTVYESKQKSNKKSPKKENIKTPIKQYSIPYRYNSSITIDLFQAKKSRSKSSYSKEKSNSKDFKLVSPSKKPLFNRDLMKSTFEQQNQDKINRTLQKLQRYKFVQEYIQRWQIMQKINGYMQSNQPQCKWSLLIVDHIFQKLKHQNNYQAFISK